MFLVLVCYIGYKPTHHIKILNKPMTFACLWFMYVKLVCVLIVRPYWASWLCALIGRPYCVSLLWIFFMRPQWCLLSVRPYCSSILCVLNASSSVCVCIVIAFYASLVRVLILGFFVHPHCVSSMLRPYCASLMCFLDVRPWRARLYLKLYHLQWWIKIMSFLILVSFQNILSPYMVFWSKANTESL